MPQRITSYGIIERGWPCSLFYETYGIDSREIPWEGSPDENSPETNNPAMRREVERRGLFNADHIQVFKSGIAINSFVALTILTCVMYFCERRHRR